ncbi:hypothetical protein [Oceanobacillus sp. Castelsardo]|uniref:hypothetical protein n=1 Tax=Oceanobacillus sp. Castelsardo TaxID=1851204 RepID=UPI000838FF0A|nr:hypothetical protein [Oceanobacillus sp. Castelsardo]
MSRKQKSENSFAEGVLKPLKIALLIGLTMGVFAWLYSSFIIVPLLLFILSVLILLGLGGTSIYLFFRLIKGMRKGKSYTFLDNDTPVKRFFEYVFVTFFTLGIGLILILAVLYKVMEMFNIV